MERVILHSDANSFYASVETLFDSSLRGKPVAVCGDPSARHGIVLTKSYEAKKYGVQTAEPIWQAKRKCPQLIIIPPNFPLYETFSRKLRKIYDGYTDRVEPFGLDEAWLDVSDPGRSVESAEAVADEIRRRVQDELGITVSVGVSFNKVFAKLGSDIKKPNATTCISIRNYREKVWPLPVNALLFCGHKTTARLEKYNILTIGDLANADDRLMKSAFGVNGGMLKSFALGHDQAPVLGAETDVPMKSIGNSTTTPHDIACLDDAKNIFYLLSECVAKRLRENGVRAKCVSVGARGADMGYLSCQKTISYATNLTSEISTAVMELFTQKLARNMPYRMVGVQCSTLVAESAPEQLDMLGICERRDRLLKLEREIDSVRERFGYQVVQRGVVLEDRAFSRINPTNHIQPAATYYTGA